MTEPIEVTAPISGTDRSISFQTGKLAKLADGAVLARQGDTIVLVTATAAKTVREGIDFFPLTVDVEERMYAAGKIPGSFFRREGKASDAAILTSRLIDRPLRPCFEDGFRNEVHVVVTTLGADQENPHDILAINGASAALLISGIPFQGPVGAVRIAYSQQGTWIPNPTFSEGDESTFEMVVAGRSIGDGPSDIAIMMVEAGGAEKAFAYFETGAPKVTEEVIAEGLEASKKWIREVINLQLELKEKVGSIEIMEYNKVVDYDDDLYQKVVELAENDLKTTVKTASKGDRNKMMGEIKEKLKELLTPDFEDRLDQISAAVKSLTKKLVRQRIVEENLRIDGRNTKEIRPLSAEVSLLPTAHGSGLFERGETQVINVTTLGMPRMNQLLDSITTDEYKRYMHHYNFPPFSTGEPGAMRGPKRREIGHGLLAERALLPVVPPLDEFPYTLRVVSDVLASNGSTSMASVCGSTLSLMDAGVPLIAPVAGIAMGLIFEEGKYVTLTDILGDEDAYGDMDFKVAGTQDVVTALQLDTKIDGIPAEVLSQALNQAKEARLTILGVIKSAIAEPRKDVSPVAPKIVTFKVDTDKIGEIIGPKGKTINSIQSELGVEINIDETDDFGVVTIGSKDSASVNEAVSRIELILNPPSVEIGMNYSGTVVNITKFGAFINVLPGRDGLLHVSRMGNGQRINNVEDVISLGQNVDVVVDDVDDQGKISLSLADPGSLTSESVTSKKVTESREDSSEFRADRESKSHSKVERVSFEDEFESQFGDLGPEPEEPRTSNKNRNSSKNRHRR